MRLLTFELTEEGDTMQIHGDEAGLWYLVERIECLLRCRESEHEHLMSPRWGGNDLSAEKQGDTNTLLDHVKIHLWR